MKAFYQTLGISAIISLTFSASSCKKEQNDTQIPPITDQTEIAQMERETGQQLFKRNIIYNYGGNYAVLCLATKSQEYFKKVVENYEVLITPVYKGEKLTASGERSNFANGTNKPSINENIEAETITAEFVNAKTNNDVIGFKASFQIKKADQAFGANNVRAWHFVEVISGHWPDKLWMSGDIQSIEFRCKRKWYNSWEMDTNCIIASDHDHGDLVAGNCNSVFYAEDAQVKNVNWDLDGPWKSKFRILTNDLSYHFIFYTGR